MQDKADAETRTSRKSEGARNANAISGLKSAIKRIPIIGKAAVALSRFLKCQALLEKALPDIRSLVESQKIVRRDAVYLGDYRAVGRTIFGHKMIMDTRDSVLAPAILMDGCWEMGITRVILDLLKTGMNVLEVGANAGYYSVLMGSRLWLGGRLYAFEANPEIFRILQTNIEINGMLGCSELVNKAVMDKSDKISFYVVKECAGGSSIAPKTGNVLTTFTERRAIEVEAVSLDEYFKGQVPRIDFVRLDTEGSEPFIFDGMTGILAKNPNIIVITEFDPAMIERAGRNPKEFLTKLKDHWGFRLKWIMADSTLVEKSVDEIISMGHGDLYLKRD
jgi:FkbM family methyltransferase